MFTQTKAYSSTLFTRLTITYQVVTIVKPVVAVENVTFEMLINLPHKYLQVVPRYAIWIVRPIIIPILLIPIQEHGTWTKF